MKTLFLTVPILIASVAADAEETRPVIMQSLCTPVATEARYGRFGFELIQTSGKWSARIYPVSGSNYPPDLIEFSDADVRFIKSPNPGNQVLVLWQSMEKGSERTTVNAISEIVAGMPTPSPFSVDIAIGAVGDDGIDRRPYAHAACEFVNQATPYERLPL